MDATPLLLSLLYGLVRGATHAFEPDHLAAVSTLVATEPRRRRVMVLGLVWGLGHALAIVTLSIALLALRAQLPPWASKSLEVLVAFVLLYLGGMAIARAFARGPLGAVHRHRHGGVEHVHAGADDHLHLTRAGFAAAANGSERIDTVGVDATCLEVITDAVGPVTAWQHGS